jgi:hypothetical protein
VSPLKVQFRRRRPRRLGVARRATTLYVARSAFYFSNIYVYMYETRSEKYTAGDRAGV